MSIDIVIEDLKQYCKIPAKEIKEDKERWMQVIKDLNRQSTDITYALVKGDLDGYFYIVPIVSSLETVITVQDYYDEILDGESPEGIPKQLCFSEKQFEQKEYAWELPKDDDFILHIMKPVNSPDDDKYVGRFSYNPFSRELIVAPLQTTHAAYIKMFGNHEYNEYQRGIYVKKDKTILIRPYWNPKDENGEFDPYAQFNRPLNNFATKLTLKMLKENGVPNDVEFILNVSNMTVKQYCYPYV